jgi:hypothetical protein
MMVMVAMGSMYMDDADPLKVPYWVSLVEGRQCGYYHDRVVAYDYALDISERGEWEEQWGVRSEWYNR